jgi:hypothetical protein
MVIYGGVVVPALDALSCKLKSVMQSFKKKKGALPAEVDQVQKEVWNTTKASLKELQRSIEEQAVVIEAALNASFSESQVSEVCQSIPAIYLSSLDAESLAPIQTLLLEKSSEFAREKISLAVRVNQTASLVSKQIKGLVDTRFK